MKVDQVATPPVRSAGVVCVTALLCCTVLRNVAHAQAMGGVLGITPTMDLADAASVRIRASQLMGEGPSGSLTIRRPSFERKAAQCGAYRDTLSALHAELLPLRARTLLNSAYPLDINNGAVWSGRGLTVAAELGGTLHAGPLAITAYPIVAFQENRDFTTRAALLSGLSPFAYVGHANIDWPQRPGDESFRTIDPGQSRITS